MTAEWGRFFKGARELRVDGDCIEVRFSEGRHHVLSVEETSDSYRLQGVVAKAYSLSGVPDLAVRVWRRNRSTTLAGFRIDHRGRVLGESLVPKAGLSAEEFQQWVRIVAAECDRFEHVLTGKDLE